MIFGHAKGSEGQEAFTGLNQTYMAIGTCNVITSP